MTKSVTSHLRLYREAGAVLKHPEHDADERLTLQQAFADATGWTLDYPESTSRRCGAGAGELRLQPAAATGDASRIAVPYEQASRLAASLARLTADLARTRDALRKREAELAAGVPLIAADDVGRHLAERLEAVLEGIARAVGCCAAAVYLLDSGTTELKLRSAWGLPDDRYLEPARTLRGAKADLEALAGHAVALEDAADLIEWNLPEPYPAAVCVPISSPTTPLGTLWVFAERARPFSDHDVNLVEIGAGRIASDLEREMLMTETHDVARLRRQWDAAQHRRAVRVPQVAPLLDLWEIAGWSSPRDEAAGEFFDWLVTSEGTLTACVGGVEDEGFAAALGCEAVRSAWRAHAHHAADAGRLLELVNGDLWCGAAEPVPTRLLTLAAGEDGRLTWSAAGEMFLLTLTDGEEPQLTHVGGLPLAADGDSYYSTSSRLPASGAVVIAATSRRPLEQVVRSWRSDVSENARARTARDWITAVVEAARDDDPTIEPAAFLVLRRTR